MVRNSLYRLLHTSWLMGNAPLHPPGVIHVIGVPRPSLFLCSSASMYYTEQKLKNKKWGRAWERGYRALAAQARDSEFKWQLFLIAVHVLCVCNAWEKSGIELVRLTVVTSALYTYLKTSGSCRPTGIYSMDIDRSWTSDDKPVANWVTDNLGGRKEQEG